MMSAISIYSVPPFLTALLFCLFGLYVLTQQGLTRDSLAYTLWCFTTVYWLLLGEKSSEEPYTPEDIVLLRIVANQAALAFERPKLVHEITGSFVHEIKMPLANISLPAELTFMDVNDLEEGKKSVQEIASKIKSRMKYIMDQATLAGSRVEAVRQVAGSDNGERKPLNLTEVIQNSLLSLEELIKKFKIKVHLDLPPDVKSINGNSKQLEIVFMNLIKNAIEAMSFTLPSTLHELHITLHEQVDQVVIQVQDSGPGIKPENLNFLFKSYFTTKGSKGTGMGLYLSRQIIQAHGGDIQVASEEGNGTKFIVILPQMLSKLVGLNHLIAPLAMQCDSRLKSYR